MHDGALQLFSWRGAPVLLHWSVLFPIVMAALGDRASPASFLGAGVVILVHELGHALLVQRYGLRVDRIVIHALGGECIFEEPNSARQHVIIAWGGVLAQLVLFACALWVARSIAPIHSDALRDLFSALIAYNGLCIVLNLLPIRPLDGHVAWRLKHLWSVRKKATKPRTPSATKRSVSSAQQEHLELVVDNALKDARTKKQKSDES